MSIKRSIRKKTFMERWFVLIHEDVQMILELLKHWFLNYFSLISFLFQ